MRRWISASRFFNSWSIRRSSDSSSPAATQEGDLLLVVHASVADDLEVLRLPVLDLQLVLVASLADYVELGLGCFESGEGLLLVQKLVLVELAGESQDLFLVVIFLSLELDVEVLVGFLQLLLQDVEFG